MTFRVYKRLSKSGPTWSFCISLGKDADGKRLRETKHGYDTKREANEFAQARVEQLKAEGARRDNSVTFGAFVAMWLKEYAGRKCSPKTLERYGQLAHYLSKEIRDTPIAKLETLALDREANRLREFGGTKRGTLSAKTVHHVFGVVNAALNRAVALRFIPANPAAFCTLPTVEKKEAKALDLEDTQLLLDALADHWLYPIVFFAAATGCRRGEILALRWSEIDFENRVAYISRSLEQTKAGLRIKKPKSNEVRDCPLPESLCAVLLDHRNNRQAGYMNMFGKDYRTDQGHLVFAAPDGNYLKPDSITADVCTRARKAGFIGVGLHSLRHGHGSQLLAAGVPLPTVSKRLGHASPEITARVYSHSFKKQEREAADIWEGLLKENARNKSGQQLATIPPQLTQSMAALTGFEPVSKP